MNLIEHSYIQNRLESNSRLSTGLVFLSRLSSEGILDSSTTGLSPAIVGGAVRDVIFENSEPNDIDIFFYRNTSTGNRSRTDYHNSLNRLREDLLLWLEDQNIEHESLLSPQAEGYTQGNRFLDIISFVWLGVNIQVMIPRDFLNTASSVGSLVSQMPLISGAAITLNRLVFSDSFLASQFLRRANIYPAGIERNTDYQYLRRKRPNGRILPISNLDALVYTAMADISLSNFLISAETPSVSVSTERALSRLNLINDGIRQLFPEIGSNFRSGIPSSGTY